MKKISRMAKSLSVQDHTLWQATSHHKRDGPKSDSRTIKKIPWCPLHQPSLAENCDTCYLSTNHVASSFEK